MICNLGDPISLRHPVRTCVNLHYLILIMCVPYLFTYMYVYIYIDVHLCIYTYMKIYFYITLSSWLETSIVSPYCWSDGRSKETNDERCGNARRNSCTTFGGSRGPLCITGLCIYVNICTYICINMHNLINMYKHTYVNICVCVWVYLFWRLMRPAVHDWSESIYMYIYIYIYIYICRHMFMYMYIYV